MLRFEGVGSCGREWMKGVPAGGTAVVKPGAGDLKDTHG